MSSIDVQLKIKGVAESGSFEGFAGVYDEVDLQGDVLLRGSFKQAIASQGPGYPLLWAHDQTRLVGLAKISDSAPALVVHGELDLEDTEGKAAYNRIQKKYVRGLSIGYTVSDGKAEYRNGARYIKELNLFELSLVAVPAQRGAVIQSIKSLADVREILSRLDASACAPDVLSELRQIDLSLKKLLDRGAQPERDRALLAELQALARSLR